MSEKAVPSELVCACVLTLIDFVLTAGRFYSPYVFIGSLPSPQFKTSNNFRTRQRRNASYYCFSWYWNQFFFLYTSSHFGSREDTVVLTTFSSYQREALTSHHSRVGSLLHPHLVTGRWERKKNNEACREQKHCVFLVCVAFLASFRSACDSFYDKEVYISCALRVFLSTVIRPQSATFSFSFSYRLQRVTCVSMFCMSSDTQQQFGQGCEKDVDSSRAATGCRTL